MAATMIDPHHGDTCPVCHGPTDQRWPSGAPEPCSAACELAELQTAAVLYVSPAGGQLYNVRDS